MKIFNFIMVICLMALMSCGGDSKKDGSSDTPISSETGTDGTSPQYNVVSAPDGSGINTPPPAEPAQNAQGVWHYTCSKGCAGGSGAADKCATCGETLVHNQAYHGQPTTTTTTTATTPLGANGAVPPAPPAEPAQNAKGVWHYTCSNGCAGGAGAATPCAKCGTTLAHNAVYHQ